MIRRIRIFGDSILKGVIYNTSSNQYSVLENSPIIGLSKTYGLEIHNSSMFGSTISKGIQLLRRSIDRGLCCEVALVE
ncbi:MAG TPA: SGNH/GDSL hydrolase family protein, partial [Sphaerochaeta sp.]|nr:SGNH/GDSL hydrolase family protein [Sphaerochaeta sp.]